MASGRLTGQDAEEVHRFREFLRQVNENGIDAVLADPEWRAYALGEESTEGDQA